MYGNYVSLMNFISKAVGPDFEITLIDTRNGQNKIIAMRYGDISGRHIGEDIAPIALKAIENKEYENSDYIANQLTYSKSGKPLRTSLFFIKDEDNNLEGIMSINFDDSRYIEFGKKILEFCHPDAFIENRLKLANREDEAYLGETIEIEQEGEKMKLESTIENLVDDELHSIDIPLDRLTQEEKIEIVKNLDNIGVFMMKGSVSILANKLDVSQASVYRYINMAREENE